MTRVLGIALCAGLHVVGSPQPTPPAFRSAIELVEIDASVTRRGTPVSGLAARDFIVTDEGIEQEIESVRLDGLPLSVQMVFDVSESVAGSRLRHLVAAGHGLLGATRPGDRVALMTFSHELRLLAPSTEDIRAVRAALSRISAKGSTALRDAVQLGLSMPVPAGTRGLTILFTDGTDTASWVSAKSALDVARRAGRVVHVVRAGPREAGSFARSADAPRFVEELTKVTGGRVWSASSESELESLFTAALSEMRARYLLTFQPKGPAKSGWHEIKVRLRTGRADIKARPGYMVGS